MASQTKSEMNKPQAEENSISRLYSRGRRSALRTFGIGEESSTFIL